MTYAVGGLIQANDINTLISTGIPNINSIWSTGSGNSGYGQTALSTVSQGSLISAAQWVSVISTIQSMASHQGSSVSAITSPSVGDTIRYIAAIPSNLSTVNTNRLNAAASGSTISTAKTNTSTWLNTLTYTFSAQFSNANTIRYFFNAGGQIGLTFSHPTAAGINVVIQDICNEFGTMWLSSPASGTVNVSGVTYNGITKIGGVASARGVANTNNGFYALTSSYSQCYSQESDETYYYYYYYGGSNLIVSASYNGSGKITFSCVFTSTGADVVSSGTIGTMIVRPPSSTYLSNTWGTPSLTSSSSVT